MKIMTITCREKKEIEIKTKLQMFWIKLFTKLRCYIKMKM